MKLKLISLTLTFIAIGGCNSLKLSDSKIKAFEENCQQKKNEFRLSVVTFFDFDYSEFKTIEVVESNGAEELSRALFDISELEYWYDPEFKSFKVGGLVEVFNVNHEYGLHLISNDS